MGLGLDPLGAGALRRFVTGVVACVSYAAELLRASAFWGTIVLPLIIVAGLVTDLATSAPVRLPLLVVLNVVCLLLSRGYRPGD
ncbi:MULTISPECIES: hypothetical protein [Haloarcula]|uniref:hypothetical protein n=1 Tax=Haloarcula TaxID=2237 RepID=UPI0023E7CEF0|nr:hypothetical protein [Halomicroarcula sp. SHR3]